MRIEEHTCGSKRIAVREFPHPSEKLSKTTTEDGHANHSVRHGDIACPGIVKRDHECRRSERKEATVEGISL